MFDKIRAWLASDIPVALGSQHVGWIVAAVLMINAGCFIAGYFWGKRAGAQEWCTVISRDAFADQIYNSLCASAVGEDEEDADNQEGADNSEGSEGEAVAQNGEGEESPEQGIEMKTQYYAQLAGFASLRSAEAFVTRLNKKQIHALIKERISKSAKGRSVRWYQVVTEPYEDQDALNSVVAILKKEEKLHDVRIVQG
jgi:hypothetical protein